MRIQAEVQQPERFIARLGTERRAETPAPREARRDGRSSGPDGTALPFSRQSGPNRANQPCFPPFSGQDGLAIPERLGAAIDWEMTVPSIRQRAKIPRYNGENLLDDHLAQVELAATLNDWSSEETAAQSQGTSHGTAPHTAHDKLAPRRR